MTLLNGNPCMKLTESHCLEPRCTYGIESFDCLRFYGIECYTIGSLLSILLDKLAFPFVTIDVQLSF